MKEAILLLLGFVFGLSSIAQPKGCKISLSGKIMDSSTEVPIAHARINISNQLNLLSNHLGKFEIKNLCKDNINLTISHISYKESHISIQLTNDTSIVVLLDKKTTNLDAVNIDKSINNDGSKSVRQLSKKTLNENKGKNLAEILQNVAGVNVLKTGSSIAKPVVNGLFGNRLILLNNGVRHESQQWGMDHAPEIDPFATQLISVIKSADAVRYGPDALGGVIRMEPKPIINDKLVAGSTTLGYNTNGHGGLLNTELEGTKKNLSYRVGITGIKSGNIKTADYYLGNTGKEELNGSALVAYRKGRSKFEAYFSHFSTTLGIFEGAHIGSKEDILVRIEHGKPFENYNFSYQINSPKQKVAHDLAKLNYAIRLNDYSSIEAFYSVQKNHRKEFDLRRVQSDDIPMANIALTTQQFESVFKHKNSLIGVSTSLQVNNNVAGTGTTPIIPNFDNHTFGFFATQNYKFKKHIIDFGFRYDYKFFDVAGYRYDYDNHNADGSLNQYLLTDTKKYHSFSGMTGLKSELSKQLTWKNNLGIAWRAPSANELYADGIHHGTGTYEVGDINLKSEQGYKYVSSLDLKTNSLNLSIDAFGQYIHNYIYSQPNPDSIRQTIRGTFPLFQYEQDNAIFYGLDISANISINDYVAYQAIFSFVRAKNITDNSYLPHIPSDRFQQSINLDIKKSKEAYIKLKHTYTARQSRYESNSDFTSPPASYHLFDVVASTKLFKNKNQQVNMLLNIENIFNTSYKDYMDRFRYYAHANGRNISLKINYSF